MAAVARKYSIIQVGITFFIKSNEIKNKMKDLLGDQQIIAYPFNFYLFPRCTIYSDPVISLQAGCIQFNTKNKMDWNRWIQKGITYMKLTQFQRIRQIQQKSKTFNELFDYLQEQNQQFISSLISDISKKNFSEKNYILPSSSFNYCKKVIEKYFDQNNFLFNLKKQQKDFQGKTQEQFDDTIIFKIIKITQKQKIKNDRKKQQQLYGFTLLFDKIWNSGKPFIGHNSMFDILFLYDAFIAQLPYDYYLWKQLITQVKGKNNFGDIKSQMIDEIQQNLRRIFYDTKLIAINLDHLTKFLDQRSSLEQIYKLFTQKGSNLLPSLKKVILHSDFQRYNLKNSILHEAGFDSYLTGWIFYQLIQFCKYRKIECLNQYAGRINLNRSYFQINLLGKSDIVCPYLRIYYIQVAKQKQYVQLDYLKKNKSDVLKSLRQIVKKQDIAKSILIHQGNKQIFIQIKDKQNYGKITNILLKYVKNKQIKDLHSLARYLTERRAKQMTQSNTNN